MATPCLNEKRIDDHSDRIERLECRVRDGDVSFAEVRKDIEALTEKVGDLTGVIRWVGGAIGIGLLGTAGTALIWVISHMGGK